MCNVNSQICDFCGEHIEGEFVRYGHGFMHVSCLDLMESEIEASQEAYREDFGRDEYYAEMFQEEQPEWV
jgi:hypothetical protein